MSNNDNMIKLVRLFEGNQFAGEPEQKPGDQVRGTDKAVGKGKQHPFHNRLVGEEISLEDKLSKRYQDMKDVQAKEKEQKKKEESDKQDVSEVSDTTLKNYKRTSAGDAINRQNIANRSGAKDPKIAKRNAGQERAEKKLQGVAEGQLDNPGESDSPVASAIIRRILLQRTDLLSKYGPEKVGAAVDEVADFVGDVDEIGSSDVSGWVRHVEQMLGNMNEQGVAEGSEELYGLKVGDTVKATVRGVKVQGDVIDIFPETEQVELLLRGANAGRTVTVDVQDTEFINEQGVSEAGNRPVDRQFPLGTGDTRTARELKTQMQGASDEFVKGAAKEVGPMHSRVAKMQGKLAKSELRRRGQGVAEGWNDDDDFFARADHSGKSGVAVDRSVPGRTIGRLSNRPRDTEKPEKPFRPSNTKDTGRTTGHRSSAVQPKFGYDSANPGYSRARFGEGENPADKITVDVPLMIRIMEYAREDAKDDVDLHNVAEQLVRLSSMGKTLGMNDYDGIVGMTTEQKLSELSAVPPTPPTPPQGTAAATGNTAPASGSVSPNEQTALNKIQTNPAMKQQFDKLMTQATPGAANKPMALDPEQEDALDKIKTNAGLKGQYDRLIKQANPGATP